MPTSRPLLLATGVATVAGWGLGWLYRRVRLRRNPGRVLRASFQQTMLRVKDPKKSLQFYGFHFGMRLVHKYDFPQWKFSLYFLERPRNEAVTLIPRAGTLESEDYLWNMEGTVLELTHNWGSEKDDDFEVWSGNEGNDVEDTSSPLYRADVTRGFGHVAFNVPDVYELSGHLERAGVPFQKKPDEGRMKGLAFALDPDGYWIELVKRPDENFPEMTNLSQTMLRVKDAKASVDFYTKLLGMDLVRSTDYGSFSNHFLGSLSDEERRRAPDPTSAEARDFVKTLWRPLLELTHNHGTEHDESFHVHDGNSPPALGFGHIGFLVDDLNAMCSVMVARGVRFHKLPSEGAMDNLAFAIDPSGYRVELVERGAAFAGVCSNF